MTNWFSKMLSGSETPKVGTAGHPQPPVPAAKQPSVNWAVGAVILDDYLIEKELGRGGMGRVWLVKSNSTGRRFAVKQALIRDDKHRKAFLAELQTWIDLPEHPNIVPCRFFRTVGDEIVIFADFIDGGTLADWIAKRKLTNLEQILDVAIQFAWGLHAIHERGLIHQDVKPGNVLMTADGVPMVTDFGLARARMRAADSSFISPDSPSGQQSVRVSFGGMTPAYASPEQRSRQPLSRKTDIWSWGVSVLDIFMGGVSCPYGGHIAVAVLEQFVENTQQEEGVPSMPEKLAVVLSTCFQADLGQRWANLGQAVEELKDLYHQTSGTPYSGNLKHMDPPSAPKPGVGDRRTRNGAVWLDPSMWLEKALCAEGRDPTEAAAITARQAASRRGSLVAEVAAYDEVRRIYERLVRDGRKDLEVQLAQLCSEASSVHETAGDYQGALLLYDCALAIFERLVNQEGRDELANGLADLYMNKALAAEVMRDFRLALALYDRALEIRSRLVNDEGHDELADDLAAVYSNKAAAVSHMGDHRAAAELYDQAIAIREHLVNQKGYHDLADDLARLYSNKAVAVSDLGNYRMALELYDHAIAIRERIVNREGRHELANSLATLYMNKAVTLRQQGDYRGSIDLCDRALELREPLVNQDGRWELANDLATLYMNKATALRESGDHHGAVVFYDRALGICERLVNKEGRSDLAEDLETNYMNKAITLVALEDHRGALVLYDRALEICERLVDGEGRRESADELARLYMNKANSIAALGDFRGAVDLYGRAYAVYERLVNQEDRRELTGDLAWAKAQRGVALIFMGEEARGKQVAREAMAVLRVEGNRTGRADLISFLEWTQEQLGVNTEQF